VTDTKFKLSDLKRLPAGVICTKNEPVASLHQERENLGLIDKINLVSRPRCKHSDAIFINYLQIPDYDFNSDVRPLIAELPPYKEQIMITSEFNITAVYLNHDPKINIEEYCHLIDWWTKIAILPIIATTDIYDKEMTKTIIAAEPDLIAAKYEGDNFVNAWDKLCRML
ncbi:MAG: hypothetical protein AAF153_00795, partial [Pseudomonadota bacterium]